MSLILNVAHRLDGALSALRGVPSVAEREAMQLRGAYAGAMFNRLNSDWIAASLPSDQELITDLRTLRSRCRELGRNNPFGVKFLELIQENMIGPTGIDPKPSVLGPDGKPDKVLNRQIKDRWNDFTEDVSLDKRYHLVDWSHIATSNLGQDGEIFVRRHIGTEFKYGMALQFIDPDLVDEAYNMQRDPYRGSNEVRLSVEVDDRARRVGYHFYQEPSVWGSRGSKRYFVAAEDVFHIGRSRRVNQTRYVPWFHPVMDAMKMLDGLVEAELVASRAAAAKMGWLVAPKDAPQPGEKRPDGTRAPIPMEASPGSIAIAPPGYQFQGWDPQHPTSAFATFHAAMIRRIAAGLNIAYTSLANDPGDANYSSARTALQMEQRFWRKMQQLWIRSFMRPLYDDFLKFAILSGQLDVGYGIQFEQLRRVKWEVTGWEWIDPKSDVDAAVTSIDNLLDSPQRIAALRGLDYEEDVIEPLREALELQQAAGLSKPAASGGAPPKTDTPPSRTNDGSGNSGGSANPAPSRNGSASLEPVPA